MKNNLFKNIFIVFVLSYSALVFAQSPISKSDLPESRKYLSKFIEREQTDNDRTENTKEFDSIKDNIQLPAIYRPEARAIFNLPTFLVPNESVVVLRTKKLSDAIFKDTKTGLIRFFVHPQSVNAFWPYLQDAISEAGWVATPTSSYRSLLGWNLHNKSEVYGIKVSLDTEIGAISRMLSRSQIERATVTSLALQQTPKKFFNDQGIHFIDEPVSVYFKKFQFGYTVRENPDLAAGEDLVPLFSLYAKNGKAQSKLQDMIDASGLPAKEFVLIHLIEPLLRQTLFLGFNEGFIGAPHEQNVLVKTKNGKLTKEFYYRDLGSFHINHALRAMAGKKIDFIPQSFLPENLKGEKNNLVQSIQDYLIASQFFAMVRSLRPGQISDQWVENAVLKLVTSEINLRTGKTTSTWHGAKTAVTQLLTIRTCEGLFTR